MNKFKIIRAGTYQTNNFLICKMILEDQNFSYDESIDAKQATILSRGNINPNGGFVILTPDETVILDYFELTDWIDTEDVRKI